MRSTRLTISGEPRIRILGSEVHLVSASRTVDYIERWIDERTSDCHTVVVSGFHGLWEAYKNPYIRTVLNNSDLWVPDGIIPVWVARINRYDSVERSPGADVMHHFFRRAGKNEYSSYFYGDRDSTLTALEAVLTSDYPDHKVAGMFSPPFRELSADEDDEIIERINAAHPDVLWVGLGLPKQELWIYERRARLKVPVVIGVGAAFGFIAHTVPRCPDWIGKLGFEWIFRFVKEPRKLWRRDLFEGPRFLFHLGMELLQGDEHLNSQIDSKGN